MHIDHSPDLSMERKAHSLAKRILHYHGISDDKQCLNGYIGRYLENSENIEFENVWKICYDGEEIISSVNQRPAKG